MADVGESPRWSRRSTRGKRTLVRRRASDLTAADAADQAMLTVLTGLAATSVGRHTSIVHVGLRGIEKLVQSNGSAAATQTLMKAASIISMTTRSGDYSFEVDDHEFEIVLPDCDADGARSVCQRLKSALEAETSFADHGLEVVTRVLTARYSQ